MLLYTGGFQWLSTGRIEYAPCIVCGTKTRGFLCGKFYSHNSAISKAYVCGDCVGTQGCYAHIEEMKAHMRSYGYILVRNQMPFARNRQIARYRKCKPYSIWAINFSLSCDLRDNG
jgi:hypothetical protein